jgi:hypothetical protein
MPMELDVVRLTEQQRATCLNTISPNTFFMIVADALVSGLPLSVVRMGDGEKALFLQCMKAPLGSTIRPPNSPFNEEWLRGIGCFDIPSTELARRLKVAAEESTYYAPNIMGIQRGVFGVASLFASRDRFVDNWFVRTWSKGLQEQLLKQARHVLFIHARRDIREIFASRVRSLGLQIDCVAMETWRDADSVIAQAVANDARLVLFAGGPAGKYIAPAIATGGNRPKVVLDLGHAASAEWI